MNPNSPAQQPTEDPDYDGPILPGSRWRQEGMSGHTPQVVTILRVGARSVMLTIEGGGHNKGGKHRPGQQFNVVIEDFRRTHRLLSQPKGFRPEVDLKAGEIYDRSVKPLSAATMGEARNQALAAITAALTFTERSARANAYGPLPRVVPPLGEGYEAVPSLPGTTLPKPPTEPTEPTPEEPEEPKEEPPVSSEPQPNVVPLPPAVAAGLQAIVSGVSPHAEVYDEVVDPLTGEEIAPDYSPGYSPEEEPVAEGEAQEVDPIEQFMESGRVLVERANAKIARAQDNIDTLTNALALARDDYDRLVRQKKRIEDAVLSAIATAGEEDEAPPLPEQIPVPAGATAFPPTVGDATTLRVVTTPDGSKRLYGATGFVAQPGKVTQKEWAMTHLVKSGRLALKDHVDDFAREYGLDRDRATKNLSSALVEQIKRPNARWPKIERVGIGVYAIAK